MHATLVIISLIGIVLSFYMYLIERALSKNPAYKPACDISDRISCSAPIKSKYSHLLYLSNATWGLLFYTVVLLTALLDMQKITLLLTTVSIIYSLYLAYILIFKIRSWCLICLSLYGINIVLFIISLLWYLA